MRNLSKDQEKKFWAILNSFIKSDIIKKWFKSNPVKNLNLSALSDDKILTFLLESKDIQDRMKRLLSEESEASLLDQLTKTELILQDSYYIWQTDIVIDDLPELISINLKKFNPNNVPFAAQIDLLKTEIVKKQIPNEKITKLLAQRLILLNKIQKEERGIAPSILERLQQSEEFGDSQFLSDPLLALFYNAINKSSYSQFISKLEQIVNLARNKPDTLSNREISNLSDLIEQIEKIYKLLQNDLVKVKEYSKKLLIDGNTTEISEIIQNFQEILYEFRLYEDYTDLDIFLKIAEWNQNCRNEISKLDATIIINQYDTFISQFPLFKKLVLKNKSIIPIELFQSVQDYETKINKKINEIVNNTQNLTKDALSKHNYLEFFKILKNQMIDYQIAISKTDFEQQISEILPLIDMEFKEKLLNNKFDEIFQLLSIIHDICSDYKVPIEISLLKNKIDIIIRIKKNFSQYKLVKENISNELWGYAQEKLEKLVPEVQLDSEFYPPNIIQDINEITTFVFGKSNSLYEQNEIKIKEMLSQANFIEMINYVNEFIRIYGFNIKRIFHESIIQEIELHLDQIIEKFLLKLDFNGAYESLSVLSGLLHQMDVQRLNPKIKALYERIQSNNNISDTLNKSVELEKKGVWGNALRNLDIIVKDIRTANIIIEPFLKERVVKYYESISLQLNKFNKKMVNDIEDQIRQSNLIQTLTLLKQVETISSNVFNDAFYSVVIQEIIEAVELFVEEQISNKNWNQIEELLHQFGVFFEERDSSSNKQKIDNISDRVQTNKKLYSEFENVESLLNREFYVQSLNWLKNSIELIRINPTKIHQEIKTKIFTLHEKSSKIYEDYKQYAIQEILSLLDYKQYQMALDKIDEINKKNADIPDILLIQLILSIFLQNYDLVFKIAYKMSEIEYGITVNIDLFRKFEKAGIESTSDLKLIQAFIAFFQFQDYHNAAILFGETQIEDIINPEILFFEGLSLMKLGRFAKAEKVFLAILSLDPNHVHATESIEILHSIDNYIIQQRGLSKYISNMVNVNVIDKFEKPSLEKLVDLLETKFSNFLSNADFSNLMMDIKKAAQNHDETNFALIQQKILKYVNQ